MVTVPTGRPALSPATSPPALPPLSQQAERLIGLGTMSPDLSPADVRAAAARLEESAGEGALLVLHERVAPPSSLAVSLRLPAPGRAGAAGEEREGFVVADMTDVDAFVPTGVDLPDADVYAVAAPTRGDELRSWTPAEACAALAAAGRSPLTLAEGIHWALQVPGVLDRNACFMTIGSRLPRARGGFDARTPALWISGGTGRDGRKRRGAPKVGWCWWNNHHTWLGYASTRSRIA